MISIMLVFLSNCLGGWVFVCLVGFVCFCLVGWFCLGGWVGGYFVCLFPFCWVILFVCLCLHGWLGSLVCLFGLLSWVGSFVCLFGFFLFGWVGGYFVCLSLFVCFNLFVWLIVIFLFLFVCLASFVWFLFYQFLWDYLRIVCLFVFCLAKKKATCFLLVHIIQRFYSLNVRPDECEVKLNYSWP